MRLPLIPEMVAPAVALAVVLAATLAAWPAMLLALPLVWFGPTLLRGWLRTPLDERESSALARAEGGALRLLLVAAAALPWLLSVGGAATLIEESADLGFLLLAVFVARAVLLAAATMAPLAAAQAAGSFAFVVAAVLLLGRSWPAGLLPVLALIVALLPHLLARPWPSLAAWLWGAGALLATANALTAGFAPIEVVLLLALLAGPWATAGLLASQAARQPAVAA